MTDAFYDEHPPPCLGGLMQATAPQLMGGQLQTPRSQLLNGGRGTATTAPLPASSAKKNDVAFPGSPKKWDTRKSGNCTTVAERPLEVMLKR